MLYMNTTVTTKKNLTVHTEKKMRMESKHNTKKIQQTTWEDRKKKGTERNYKNS